MELVENRYLVEVRNDSEHEFVFDGEWLRAGEWKSNRTAPIPANSVTVLEFQSTGARGVAGVIWWTDSKEHDVYLSLALANPRLQTASFACFAGCPPTDLKAELDLAPRLVQGEQCMPENGGCAWLAAQVGNFTVVKLTVLPSLARYVPPKPPPPPEPKPSAEAGAEAEGGDSATGDGSAAASRGTSEAAGGKSPPRAAPVLSDCTALATAGGSGGEDLNEEDAREAFNKFMVQTRPKDALDGLSRGLKTAGTSVAMGVGSVVASAVQGYQQGGLGLLKGLGTGLVGGAAIAVGGTACGAAQIGRGLANTPEALRGRREQRVWDQELGQWVDIDLCALEGQVAAECSDDEDGGPSSSGAGSGDVLETEYYDLLKVKPTATMAELKKAYYKEARICHPDKNPDDAEAKVKFQKLADAYQVLSDPASRKKYDREGKEGIQNGNVKLDPTVFFSLLFGSGRFEPWIGELHLAMQTDQFAKSWGKEASEEKSMEDFMDAGEDKVKKKQLRREVRCACHLRDKLDRYVYGRDTGGFEEQMRLEAVELGSGQFGPELLSTLADIYQLRAEIYLADELVGRFSLTKRMASVRHSTHTWHHRFKVVQSMAGMLMTAKKVRDAAGSAEEAATAASAAATASDAGAAASTGGSGAAAAGAGSGGAAASGSATPGGDGSGDTADGAAAAGEDSEQVRKAAEDALEEALPVVLQTVWAAVVTDIDGTIKEVGRKLLKDKSVGWQIRVRRAQALQRLGQIFAEEGARALRAQGESSLGQVTTETAKAMLQEALVGSCVEKK